MLRLLWTWLWWKPSDMAYPTSDVYKTSDMDIDSVSLGSELGSKVLILHGITVYWTEIKEWFSNLTPFPQKILCMYVCVINRSVRKRGDICWLTPQIATQPSLGEAKPRIRNSTQISHMGWQGPGSWAISHAFLGGVTKRLGQKCSSWDSNQHRDIGCPYHKQQHNYLCHNAQT